MNRSDEDSGRQGVRGRQAEVNAIALIAGTEQRSGVEESREVWRKRAGAKYNDEDSTGSGNRTRDGVGGSRDRRGMQV